VSFEGADKAELNGLTNLLRHDALYAQRGKKHPLVGSTFLPGAGYLGLGGPEGVMGGVLFGSLGTAEEAIAEGEDQAHDDAVCRVPRPGDSPDAGAF
jgi:hypothetical protein